MTNNDFLTNYELINAQLPHVKVERSFNSIGSNIFVEFGKKIEEILKNGRKTTFREWSIWIGDASWRISKNGKYVVGSDDYPQSIQHHIQELVGLQFVHSNFLSSFLDIEFDFENGYKLTTFFNWSEEDQWTIFLPNGANIGTDCSSQAKINEIQNIASFHFEDNTLVVLHNCTWRLTKNNTYLIGNIDDDNQNILSELIGKKLKQVRLLNSEMDAQFHFEEQYILETFTCYKTADQWEISTPDGTFHGKIELDT